MRIRWGILGVAATGAAGLIQACDTPVPSQSFFSVQVLSPDLCAPDRGGFTAGSTNPYFPLPDNQQWVLEGTEEGVAVRVEIDVLSRTERVAGVTTRVVREQEWADGVLIEVSHNFYAQAVDGTVCYFGEDVDIFEGGTVSHDGAWRADGAGNRPGIIMPAAPQVGMRFQMEGAPGIAEDEGTIVGTGPVLVPAGRFTETVRVRESNPLDRSRGYKVFAAGVGMVVDGPVELVPN